jgi:hypothetical protein
VIGDDACRQFPVAKPLGPLGNYSESELDTLRRRISAWRSRGLFFVC